MTIRFIWTNNPYKESDRERRVFSESAEYIADAVGRIIAKGGRIIEIISPPPGTDDREDGECVEYVSGQKCYVRRVKFGGKWNNQYRFCVCGFEEVKTLTLSSAKRIINGQTRPYVFGDF